MKNAILLFLLICPILSYATVRTVNNNPAGIAQYSDLQTAINAASQGDTIYVHGSKTNYGNAEITDKKITLIGPGIDPDKEVSFSAKVSGVFLTNLNTTNTDGSVIMGLHITSLIRVSNTGSGNLGYPVNGVKIIRNRFSNAALDLYVGNWYGSAHMYNLFVEGNYFENSDVGAGTVIKGEGSSFFYTNCLFVNNIFCRNAGPYYSTFIHHFNRCTNVVFDHNLFYVSPTQVYKSLFSADANNLKLTNNIFINVDNQNNANITNCTFQNNLTYNCVNNTPWLLGNNVNLGGNIANQNPLMASQTEINAGVLNPLLNFSIASGVANNAGTDGKDLGVLFNETNSTMNWAFGRNSRLPYIQSMDVLNSSNPSQGQLNVQINARKAK